MLKNTSLCTSFLTFILLTFTGINAEVVQYENQKIERIDIIMMNQPEDVVCDPRVITTRIKSKINDLFSQAIFDNDLKILAGDYDRIDPNIDCVNGKVFISLRVWPKPTIRTMTWNGNHKISSYHLQKELGITSCSVFDRRAFNQAFHKLKAYYVKEGFFEAQLSYDVIPTEECNQVDIVITIVEGRAGKIKKINFVGFTCDEEEAILEEMVTKEYWFIYSWLTGEGIYQEEAIQQDEMTIVNFLQDRGYADAKVRIDVTEARQLDRIIITITADKGSLYIFGNISVTGNTLFCEDEIRQCYVIKECKHYSPERLHESIKRIQTIYGRRGYIDTVVDYEPSLSDEGCIYDIKFTIEEGKQYRVGLIKVLGNCSTQTRVILHETLLIPGEIFNTEKLLRTEERLENIGFFKSVNVYAVKSDGACGLGDNYRDVQIEVEEDSTGNFGAFAGFSTSESIFGGINITESNFNYKGLGTLFDTGLSGLRGGGEYCYFTATFGTKSSSYLLSWTKPWFKDTPWIVGFDLERSSTGYVAKDYQIDAYSLKLRAAYQVNPFLRYGMHYRIKLPHIHVDDDDDDDDSTTPDSSKDKNLDEEAKKQLAEEKKEQSQEKELKHQAHNNSLISAIGSSLVYDSTNHPVLPTKGLRSKLEWEYVGLGGENHFLKFGYSNAYFWQFKEFDFWGVWKFKTDMRFIQTVGDTRRSHVPIDERYFLGGDTFVRGFRPYKLGPEEEDNPIGGLSMQFLSLEYNRPVFKKMDLFYFIDAGSVNSHLWHFSKLYTAIGYGVRLSIFPSMPPIVLGMGYPLNANSRGQIKRFFLSVGGQF
jgi:outer membrane protein insertion porin family